MADTTVFLEIVNLEIQGNNLKQAQGYGKQKNASRTLSEADDFTKNSSGVQVILDIIKIIHNILVCLSVTVIA